MPKLGMVANLVKSWENMGKTEIQGYYPWLHSQVKAALSFMRLYLQKIKIKLAFLVWGIPPWLRFS